MKDTQKEFVPHFMTELQQIQPIVEDKVPWLNADTINSVISIE